MVAMRQAALTLLAALAALPAWAQVAISPEAVCSGMSWVHKDNPGAVDEYEVRVSQDPDGLSVVALYRIVDAFTTGSSQTITLAASADDADENLGTSTVVIDGTVINLGQDSDASTAGSVNDDATGNGEEAPQGGMALARTVLSLGEDRDLNDTITETVVSGNDDATEVVATGAVTLTDTTLNLGNQGGAGGGTGSYTAQVVATDDDCRADPRDQNTGRNCTSTVHYIGDLNAGHIRFRDVDAPKDSIITKATVCWVPDHSVSRPNVQSTFSVIDNNVGTWTSGNIADVSRRVAYAYTWDMSNTAITDNVEFCMPDSSLVPLVQDWIQQSYYLGDGTDDIGLAYISSLVGEWIRFASYNQVAGVDAPRLVLEWQESAPEPTLTGLRFTNVSLQSGDTLVDSYVQFTAAAGDSSSSTLQIAVEAADNAAGFSTTSGDLSGRSTMAPDISWMVDPWVAAGDALSAQRTPDLSSHIADVITRPGWSEDNSLVVLIDGTGQRRASSCNASSCAETPELVVEYIPAGNATGNTVVGLYYPTVSIPKTAIISDATLQFTAAAISDGPANITVRAQASDSAPPIAITDFNLSTRPTTLYSAQWQVPDWDTVGERGDDQKTPDLTLVVQEVITRENWASGNNMVFLLQGAGSREVYSELEAGGTEAPRLSITYTDSQVPSMLTGLRFDGITPGIGDTLTKTSLRLISGAEDTSLAQLTIQADADDDSAAFTTTSGDLSDRERTLGILHTPPPWAWAGNYFLPDLSGVLQQVIQRPGWVSGNAASFLVSGGGERSAISWDGYAPWAARLELEWNSSGEHGEYEVLDTTTDTSGLQWTAVDSQCPVGLFQLADGEYYVSVRGVSGMNATGWSDPLHIELEP